ncbi:alpha/beta hydrolase [Aquimarina mytili]|uniref:T9SS type A sorting domain-containing protein n=1 Tax=Aquimarina mytili TaxID=874423 RepID=A0A937D8J9_9FLAO|nr:alpha/beta hydrolase [Aquimarina mytili]MBL0682782.1 T9SS type A sorting domain-containing protein [Aquimarina mytili]
MKKHQLLLIVIVLQLIYSFTYRAQAQNESDYYQRERNSPYLREGPYQVVTDSNYTISPNILVHRPNNTKRGPFPIMLFHQGGPGIVTPRSYDVFMKHLASYGYVVVVQAITFPPNPLRDDMKLILDWIEQQVAEGADGWRGYVDTSKLIVGGHSYGGVVASSFIVNQPERALGIVYFASNAAPAPLHALENFKGKVLMIGGSEDTVASPDVQNETFDRFTSTSCKTNLYIEGADHGAFGVYDRDSPGSIGREKATESVRHFFVSFMDANFKNSLRGLFYFFIPRLQPNTVASFTSSCNPFENVLVKDELNNVTVYPNPVMNTDLNIKVNDVIKYSYKLHDVWGMEKKSDTNIMGNITIPVAELPKGIYYITVRAKGKKKVIKLRKN